LHRAGSSECIARALSFCTALHCLCSLFAPRGVVAVHRPCSAFLYSFALPWITLHRVGSSECTARALLFCTALHCLCFFLHRAESWQCIAWSLIFCITLHCLGLLFWTAWFPSSALLAHCLFYHVVLPWIIFAPRSVHIVLCRGALFFSIF
jgi:hypothetical protein